MSSARAERERLEGAYMIAKYSREIVEGLGLEVLQLDWATDLVEPHEHQLLVVQAYSDSMEPTTIEITFTREELEGYPANIGIEPTRSKVREHLHSLVA